MNVTLCPLFNVIGRLSPLRLNPVPLTFACEIVNVELPVLRQGFVFRLLAAHLNVAETHARRT